MRILGIDPGFAIVGYGVIDYENGKYKTVDYGKITTPAGMDMPLRLKEVYDGILRLIELFKPDVLAIEELFFNKLSAFIDTHKDSTITIISVLPRLLPSQYDEELWSYAGSTVYGQRKYC